MTCYCIDLDTSRPQILELSKEELAYDIEFYGGLKRIPPDRRVFKTEDEAKIFLEDYSATMRRLKRLPADNGYPCMLYKRRYLTLSAMGLKLYTERDYLKPWKKGQLFNFHDQTYYLTVRLKKISKLKDGGFRYDFENT